MPSNGQTATASPDSSSLSAAATLVLHGNASTRQKLDAVAFLDRLASRREDEIEQLEKALSYLEQLKNEYIVCIHRHFIALQQKHRATLYRLDAENDHRELLEATNKGRLSAFLEHLGATFSSFFGSRHTAVVPSPSQSEDAASNALVLIDPSAPVSTLDRSALENRVRVGEDADRRALEGIYQYIHELFDEYMAAVVLRFKRHDELQCASLADLLKELEQQEDRNEKQRQSIATLFSTIRDAFDLFEAQQAQL